MSVLVLDEPTRPTESPVGPPAVACRGLSKRFGEVVALDGVDVAVAQSSITVLLGPSGCGKTTLLRCIAGLELPTSGVIEIDGNEVTTADPRHRDVAMVFQNYGLYPNKTVRGNIEFPLRMAGMRRSERDQRVDQIATLLKIDHLRDRRPAQLSGGQRQRVGIGRALVRQPAVLLMDEPLSSLDAELRVTMRAELHALQRRIGMTGVYVTHDQAEALALADQLVVMRDGRIEQAGAPDKLFARPATTFVGSFLGRMNLLELARVPAATHQVDLDPYLDLDGATTLGWRPEDVVPGPAADGRGVTIRGPVVLTELLGSERLVHLDVAGQTLRLRQRADAPIPSEKTAHIPAQHLHRFGHDGRRCPNP